MGTIKTEKAFALSDDYPYTSLAAPPTIPDGYRFAGWNTSPAGTGTAVQGGVRYAPNSDTTLYAQWSKNQQTVKVYVYSWNNDNRVTFRTNTRGDIVTDVANTENNFTDFPVEGGKLIVNSPGVLINVIHGTINGQTQYVNVDENTATKEIPFSAGEFTEIQISKIPISQTLSVDGDLNHQQQNVYNDAGIIFGGYKYAIHWYDLYTYTARIVDPLHHEYGSEPVAYSYNRADRCFVNVAHRGTVASHEMFVSCGYQFENVPYTLTSFVNTGMQRCSWDFYTGRGSNDNFYTDYFNELSLDFRDKPHSNVYKIGYSVNDYNNSCAGVKFRGRYKLYVTT